MQVRARSDPAEAMAPPVDSPPMTDVDEQGRPEPPLAGDETDTILGFLDYQRATFAWKCAGLDAAGLQATVAASSMTLGGMLKHLAYVEDDWFSRSLHGRDKAPRRGCSATQSSLPLPRAHAIRGRRRGKETCGTARGPGRSRMRTRGEFPLLPYPFPQVASRRSPRSGARAEARSPRRLLRRALEDGPAAEDGVAAVGDERLAVRGSNSYSARVTDSALGTMRSLEVNIQGFE